MVLSSSEEEGDATILYVFRLVRVLREFCNPIDKLSIDFKKFGNLFFKSSNSFIASFQLSFKFRDALDIELFFFRGQFWSTHPTLNTQSLISDYIITHCISNSSKYYLFLSVFLHGDEIYLIRKSRTITVVVNRD